MEHVPLWMSIYFWQGILQEVAVISLGWLRKRPLVCLAVVACMFVVTVRILLMLWGLLFSGTSLETTDVSGIVVCNGSKVQEGTVQFLPEGKGQPASAKIISGQFTAKKVAVGPCRVLCFAVKETGKTVTEGGHSFPELISVVPEAYQQGVNVTIEPRHGELVLDWRGK